jgi:hypothetical protein
VDRPSLVEQQRPNQRLWRDLAKRRLFLALGFAPLPPFALGFLLIMVIGGGSPPTEALAIIGAFLAAAEVWSALAGTIFVLVLVWIRGALRRGDCLLLGVLLAFSLPYAVLLADGVVDWVTGATPPEVAWDDFEGPSDRFFATIVAVILMPFGALGGWILWRVGVRPAEPKTLDVAPVFD